KWTGRSCFWLFSRCSLLVATCYVVMLGCRVAGLRGVPYLGMSADSITPVTAFIGVLVVGVFTREGLFRWRRLETEAFARLERGMANPEKTFPYGRIWILYCTLAMGVLDVLPPRPEINVPLLALVCSVYWRACDPLPPCTGKLFELWDE